nr:ribonuclease H-like domain-containing protein [Lachnospiraceae bacterium]
MKTIQTLLSPKLCSYPIEMIGEAEDILFVDIETTGFTARTSNLYMIGCIFFEHGQIHLIQWFAEKPEEEKKILSAFLQKCRSHSILIHYNGNNFDIPYMKQKCLQYHLDEPFSDMDGVDIYKRIMPYKKMLHLENVKQKTVESYLEISREDQYNGGQLIEIYKDYVCLPSREKAELLLLHNADDMRGMLQLLPILSYADMFVQPFRVTKVQANKYTDETGQKRTEVMMKLKFPFAFPKPVTLTGRNCRFDGFENEGNLKVPIIYDTLKYFYSNYKDYYYLPAEDVAMHKSVATYVGKEFREQAKAATCYTKKEGAFLPQWDLIFTPVFKKEYGDKLCYFELTEEIKRSPAEFYKYALHIIDMLAHGKNE